MSENQQTSISNQVEMKTNKKQQKVEQLLCSVFNLPMVIIPKSDDQDQITRNDFSVKNKQFNQKKEQVFIKQGKYSNVFKFAENLVGQQNSNIQTNQTIDTPQLQRIRNFSLPVDRLKQFQKTLRQKSLYTQQDESSTATDNPLQRYHPLNKLQTNAILKITQRVSLKQQYKQSDCIQLQQLKKKKQITSQKVKKDSSFRIFYNIDLDQIKNFSEKKILSTKRYIQQFDKNIINQKQKFVKYLANKLIQYIQTSNYQKQCEIEQFLLKSDNRKTNVINLSKLFYQNLELSTRANYFPQLFHSEMILNLFYNSKRKTSVYVGQRCYFYKNNITFIPKEQKLAISLEYLFFELIIPNLLKIAEGLDQVSIKVQEEVINNLLGIASIMHKQFLQKFQNLKKLQSPNANMTFKRLNLQELDDDEVLFEIIENKEIGNKDLVIDGLIDVRTFIKLEAEKPFWKSQMEQLFDRICSNVEKLINF